MQYVEDVDWSEVCINAPLEMIILARQTSKEGIPTKFGKYVKNGETQWVICQCGQGDYIALYEKDLAYTTRIKGQDLTDKLIREVYLKAKDDILS